jgi:FeS assembly SUF system protein
MILNNTNKELEAAIIDTIKEIFDPEIPVNIMELGLIYEVKINDQDEVLVTMTLTAPNCPVAESMPQDVKNKVAAVKGVKSAEVELTFEPPWEQSMMSELAKLELGML